MPQPIRVLIAKPGLDGHDRGALVVAQGLRDEGMEVIYTGLRQTAAQIVATAIEEDVACVGLSSLSGAHMTLFPDVVRGLQNASASDILIIGGGVIPQEDIVQLKSIGMAEVFTPGSTIKDMAEYIRAHAKLADYSPATMPVLGLDHVGIAVANLDESIAFYEGAFGLRLVQTETIEDQGVQVAMLSAGSVHLELLSPLAEDTSVAQFLKKRGPGLHHLAFEVSNIEEALEAANQHGLQCIDTKPRRGAGGKQIAFLHPKSTGGVLTEYCQTVEIKGDEHA